MPRPLDPDDPVDRVIAKDTAADHARAGVRGQRVRALTNRIISALDGHGVLSNVQTARAIITAVIADDLYGNAAVDIDPRPW